KRSALLIQEADLKGRVDAFEKAVKDGRYTRAELLVLVTLSQATAQSVAQPNAAPTLQSTAGGSIRKGAAFVSVPEGRLTSLEVQEKALREEYGPDHPQVTSVRRQINLLRSQMGQLSKPPGEDSRLDAVKIYIQALKLELENTRLASVAMEKLLKEEHRRTKELRSIEKQDEAYRTEIARTQLLFDAISKRLDEVSLLKSFSGGYEAETIAPAEAGVKVSPRAALVFGGFALLGLIVGFGL